MLESEGLSHVLLLSSARSSAFVLFAHSCDFAEVVRAAFGGFLAAFLAQSGSRVEV